jgi:hypothetical protein
MSVRLSSEEFAEKFYTSIHGGWVCRECGALTQDYDIHAQWHDRLAFTELANRACRNEVKFGTCTGPDAHDL